MDQLHRPDYKKIDEFCNANGINKYQFLECAFNGDKDGYIEKYKIYKVKETPILDELGRRAGEKFMADFLDKEYGRK